MSPLGLIDPFTGVEYQITYQIFALQFSKVAKLQFWSSNEINFMVGNMKNCIKALGQLMPLV